MRDDQGFNIEFVKLIRAHPCLYDFTANEYHRSDLQDQAWKSIANEVDESVTDCKYRWKNLRGTYTRHLRNIAAAEASGQRKSQSYYLAPYISFLHPFTKTREPKNQASVSAEKLAAQEENNLSRMSPIFIKTEELSNDQFSDSSSHELLQPQLMLQVDIDQSHQADELKIKEEFDDSEKCNEHKNLKIKRLFHGEKSTDSSVAENSDVDNFTVRPITHKKYSYNRTKTGTEVSASVFENFIAPEQNVGRYFDADAAFLISVLPDMKEMTHEQKRKFKIGVLNLAGDILKEQKNRSNVISPGPSAANSPASTSQNL